MTLAPSLPVKHATALGVLCGAGSALFWAFGFVAARHGVLVGLSPLVLSLHRFVWSGLILLPFMATSGFRDLGGVGWRHGILLTAFGDLPLALWSYFGYVFVPLGHGAIIQPSCAAVGGLILARIVLKEALPWRRVAGALTIVFGLCVGDLRHAAAALPNCADAGGRRHQHLVARRPAATAVVLRQHGSRRILGKFYAGYGARLFRRRRRHLSVHPRSRAAPRQSLGALSPAG